MAKRAASKKKSTATASSDKTETKTDDIKRLEDLSDAEIAERLAKKNDRDVKKCTREIEEVLDKYKCRLMPVVTLAGTQIRPSIDIVKRARSN
jgi:hypothetical protein